MGDEDTAARQRAEAVFGAKVLKDDLQLIQQRRTLLQKETEKLQRLRGLRLAKEAADREERAVASTKRSGRPKRVVL